MADQSLFSLENKVALVTGGSSGIGYMIAAGLAARGVKVIVAGRNPQRINDAMAGLASIGDCTGVPADVTQPEGRAALLAAIEPIGRLDILVNNAGAAFAAPIEQTPPERFDPILRVNLSAPFALVAAMLPLLRKGAIADDPARIINISSIDAIRIPVWESYAYGASKAALAHLTRHLAKTLAPEGITVNAIAPGIFSSHMTRFLFDEGHPNHEKPQHVPLGRMGEPDDIVGAVTFLASRAGAYVTGILLPVSGGLATAD